MLEAIFYTALKRLRFDTPKNEDDGETPRYYAILDVGANISEPNRGRLNGSMVEISVLISKDTYDELMKFYTNYRFQAKADLVKKV
ncbi:MAG: hypothetical protein AABW51_05230 [Nanoarchaeota archaeon]